MCRKINTFSKSLLLFLIFFSVFSLKSFAYEPAEPAQAESGFDPGKLIIEHISDGYGWHIAGSEENPIVLPLPVILYSKERGLDVFLSSKFNHGHTAYKGYKLEENHIVAVNELAELSAHKATINHELTANLWDISITKNVFALLFGTLLILWMFLSLAKAYKNNANKAPRGLQSFLEPLIMFVRDDVAKNSIGPKYEKFVPYLLTVFFFIFINNLLGLIPILPGGANLTGNIAVCLVLAGVTFLITLINSNGHYWRHIFAMPGVPIGILFILTPIEILGLVLRPFVLMIRLFANITAGHIIGLAFFSIIFIFGKMSPGAGYGASVVSVLFTVFMGLMELLVAFLQAYVFTLLSAIYIGSALEEGHHAEEHH